ncbi:hypothetical protein VNO77_03868 [Canavalia gladiata]|uniref:Uncharacterized protein n=1 Tax=Canavalia gladiata TaxID=3824 RepID=A0AAN9MVM0_CANGL
MYGMAPLGYGRTKVFCCWPSLAHDSHWSVPPKVRSCPSKVMQRAIHTAFSSSSLGSRERGGSSSFPIEGGGNHLLLFILVVLMTELWHVPMADSDSVNRSEALAPHGMHL